MSVLEKKGGLSRPGGNAKNIPSSAWVDLMKPTDWRELLKIILDSGANKAAGIDVRLLVEDSANEPNDAELLIASSGYADDTTTYCESWRDQWMMHEWVREFCHVHGFQLNAHKCSISSPIFKESRIPAIFGL